MDWFYTLHPLIGILLTLHVIKTRRPIYWVFLIWLLPVIGPAVYFLVELLPDLRGNRAVSRLGADLVTVVNPGRNVRRLEEELEISDTVKNRQRLAKAYVEARRYGEAIDTFTSCLKGVYQDDPPVLLAMAEAQFLDESFDDAMTTIERLATADQNFRPLERRLLLAQVYESLECHDEALVEYEAVAKQYPGEEARCRYAMLLTRVGQHDKAQEVLQRILLSARRSPRYYRKAQHKWIQMAKQHVR